MDFVRLSLGRWLQRNLLLICSVKPRSSSSGCHCAPAYRVATQFICVCLEDGGRCNLFVHPALFIPPWNSGELLLCWLQTGSIFTGNFSASIKVKLHPGLSYCCLLSHHILLLSPPPFSLESGNETQHSAVWTGSVCEEWIYRGVKICSLKAESTKRSTWGVSFWRAVVLQHLPTFLVETSPKESEDLAYFPDPAKISCLAQPWVSLLGAHFQAQALISALWLKISRICPARVLILTAPAKINRSCLYTKVHRRWDAT